MHSIDRKEDESEEWAKRRILEDLRFRLATAEREVIRLDLLAQMTRGSVVEIYETVADTRLIELLAEIADTYERHFRAPTPASTQDVPRETKEIAA